MAGASRAIVLVHGSFVDASCWTDIATELRGRGHRTETVELHRGSLRADAEAVQEVVDAIGTSVVACGWSYGGAVITGVDLSSGSHLVYVCALMPDEDESPMALGERHPGGIDQLLGVDGAGDLVLGGNKLDEILWGDATPAKAAAARATLRSQSMTSFMESPPRVAWRTTPSTFVIGRDDADSAGRSSMRWRSEPPRWSNGQRVTPRFCRVQTSSSTFSIGSRAATHN